MNRLSSPVISVHRSHFEQIDPVEAVASGLEFEYPKIEQRIVNLVCKRIQPLQDYTESGLRPYLVFDKSELAVPSTHFKSNYYYSSEKKLVIPLPQGVDQISLATKYEIGNGKMLQDSNSVARRGQGIVVSSPDLSYGIAQQLLGYLSKANPRAGIEALINRAREIFMENIFPINLNEIPSLYSPFDPQQNPETPGFYAVKIPRLVSRLPGPVAIDQTASAGLTADGNRNILFQRDTVFIFKLDEKLKPIWQAGSPNVDTYDTHQFILSYVDADKEKIQEKAINSVTFAGPLAGYEKFFVSAAKFLAKIDAYLCNKATLTCCNKR